MKKIYILTLAYFYITLTFNPAKAENFHWKIGSEIGYYRLSDSNNLENNQSLLKFYGSLAYKGQSSNNFWGIKTQVKPEFFGLYNSTRSLKLFLEGYYTHKTPWGNWGITSDFWRFNYDREFLELSYKLNQLQGNLLVKLNKQILFASNFNYVYRTLANQIKIKTTAFVGDNRFIFALKENWEAAAGLYTERFHLKQNQNSSSRTTNSGWRVGPKMSLKYQKSMILQVDYYFLWHHSELSLSPSYDQRIRLLFGKLLPKNWSIFVLADYYLNDFNLEDSSQFQLIYYPVQTENNIHLKLEHDFNQKLDGYIKIGYVNENLMTGEQIVKGWQAVLGIEFEN